MNQVLEFHPVANIFPLIGGVEFDALVDDIKLYGLREAIVLHPDGRILDGRNRYRACKSAEIEMRFSTYDGTDAVAFVVSLNLRRRHLDESQRAMVAAKIANLDKGRPETNPPIGGFKQEEAAALLNVGVRSIQRATEVQDHAIPELSAKVEAGEISVSAAADVSRLPEPEQREIVAKGEREILDAAKRIRAARADVKRNERIEKIAEIAKGNADLPSSRRFPVIYADPPWRYENPPMGGSNRSIENHYPTMSLEEICALPVEGLATEDAILYMWATAPKLAECLQVLDAWGFSYRTNFVWIKDKIGMGYHARNQHEILLVAKRGEIPPPAVADRVSSVVEAARGAHSAKPTVFYEMIESFYPSLPKIELFCRSPRDGWDAWGNQSSAAA